MASDDVRDDVNDDARTDDREPETGRDRDKGGDDVEARIEAEVKARTRKANKEAETLRRRLNEIEAAEREKADAALPELDKLRKQIAARDTDLSQRDKAIADLRAENRRLRLERQIEAEMDGKVDDKELALKAIDLDLIDEDEDTGKFRGIDRAVKALLEKHPRLAAQPARAGTPPVPTGGGTPPRRPVGSGGGASDPVERARQQLLESRGQYQRY